MFIFHHASGIHIIADVGKLYPFFPILPVLLHQNMLGIAAKVRLVSPKSITRSEGKAVRVIDKRKLY